MGLEPTFSARDHFCKYDTNSQDMHNGFEEHDSLFAALGINGHALLGEVEGAGRQVVGIIALAVHRQPKKRKETKTLYIYICRSNRTIHLH